MPEQLKRMVELRRKWEADNDDTAFVNAVNENRHPSWEPVTNAEEAWELVSTMLDGYYDD